MTIGDQSIAYRPRPGAGPTIIYLPGYASDMDGTKARALDAFAEKAGYALLRFDYSGTGLSGGYFDDGTLTRWLDEALAVIDAAIEGDLIIVGSSMGGWLGLHVTVRRSDRVQAFVGISSAPDFTQWAFSDEERSRLKQSAHLEEGSRTDDRPTSFTSNFVASGDELLLLGSEIAIDCPVRLIHGERDEEVPLEIPLRALRALRSGDVQLTIVKNGSHRLSQPHELAVILHTLANLLEPSS